MKSIKLINLLKKLSKHEIIEFEKFVNSPYFLKRKALPGLFSILKKYHPKYDSSYFTRENIFLMAYPGKTFSDALLRKYFSELYIMLEKFIAINRFEKRYVDFNRLLAEENIEMGNFSPALERSEKVLAKLKLSKSKDEEYYYNAFTLESLKNIIYSKTDFYTLKSNSMNAIDNLIKFSLITVMKYYGIALNDSKWDKSKQDYTYLDSFVKVSESGHFATDPVISFNYYMLKSIQEPENIAHFYKMKELIEGNKDLLVEHDMASAYIYLNNYCTALIDSGEINILKEKLELNRLMLQNGLCFREEIILPFFDSVIMDSFLLNETGWAEKFLEEYQNRLPEGSRRNVVYYNSSVINLFKHEYDKAIENLSKVRFDNYYDKLKTKALNLMIFYESGMFEQAFMLTDSFKHFVSGYKSITPYLKERYNNLINSIVHLLKYGHDRSQIPDIKDYIKKPIAHKIWLIKMIKELKKN